MQSLWDLRTAEATVKKALLTSIAVLSVLSAPGAHATEDFCAVVLKPPPEVVRDKEYNPRAWLTIRDGPGTQFMRMGKLGTGDFLEAQTGSCKQLEGKWICDDKDEWVHINSIPRFDGPIELRNSRSSGWVRSKYVQTFACPEDQAEDPLSSGYIKPEDLPGQH
jgi:hypothetical protein